MKRWSEQEKAHITVPSLKMEQGSLHGMNGGSRCNRFNIGDHIVIVSRTITPNDKTTKKGEDEKRAEDKKSFLKVLVSAFISLFLMRTVECRLSLTFSSLTAFADAELDDGYKLGYLVSWFLGDVGGILLTMCLSFTALAFGKTSSRMVSMIVLFLRVCAYVASYVPLPPGTTLVLLDAFVSFLILLDAFFKRQDSL